MLIATEDNSLTNLNPDPLYSMIEAAEYLSVSVSTIYEIAKREQFPFIWVTTDRKIQKSVLDDYISRKKTPWRWQQSLKFN